MKYIHYLVFDYLISFTLSHLRTRNNGQTDVGRSLQLTDWSSGSSQLIPVQLAIHRLPARKLADSQVRGSHFRITLETVIRS